MTGGGIERERRCARGAGLGDIVLDRLVPRVDGLSLCRAARKRRLNHDVPILIVTAKREESDAVASLENSEKSGVCGSVEDRSIYVPSALKMSRRLVSPGNGAAS